MKALRIPVHFIPLHVFLFLMGFLIAVLQPACSTVESVLASCTCICVCPEPGGAEKTVCVNPPGPVKNCAGACGDMLCAAGVEPPG